MHHLEEKEFYFPYMYYFNTFTKALRNYDAILLTFQLPLVHIGSPFIQMVHMKFGFDWPGGLREEEL